MKKLQIVDYSINIGPCKVYSRDFITNISWFIKHLNSEFLIPNSEFRILNSEFRISKKQLWMEICFCFGDATSGSVHGDWPRNPKLEQFKQYKGEKTE